MNFKLATMKKVLVTGATGQTGSLVFQKLKNQPEEFAVVGFARSPEKAQQLFNSTDNLVFGDITSKPQIESAIAGCDALVILTSASPKMVAPPSEGNPPKFAYDPEGMPEQVDYHGQVNQIEAAKQAGVKQIVLVGSMGGTDPNHMLNRMGNGNILVWKRKAEQHLIDSGVDYTIIHAGGLLNEPGGVRELEVGRDDSLLSKDSPEGATNSLPREDVANLVVNALSEANARNKAFDVVSKREDDPKASVTKDFASLFAQTTGGL